MKKIFGWHLSMLVMLGLLGNAAITCSDPTSDAGVTELAALSGLTSLQESSALANGASYFHTAVHPPHWLQWTTDGSAAIQTGNAFLAQGLRCDGRYCDNVNLLSSESGFTHTNSSWTDYFSEEGNRERICPNNGFVTGLRCSGRYCDNVSLRCSQLNNNGVRTACYWTAPVSEESGGKFVAPESMYLAGVRCSGRYCDNKELYLCQADAGSAPVDTVALANQFAPRLRFDQLSGTGSGDQQKCFPGDPESYYAQRAQGVQPQTLCNKDYATIQNNQIPTYYMASQVGTNAVLIRYWYFYAWQSTCFASAGSHAADWESMAVLIVNGELQRVAYYQHGGWYAREKGGFEVTNGSHPVAYVGKNAHGSYHDTGGSGGCLYFEDFRNPSSNDYHMDTWNNLNLLERGSGSPAWMNCTGSGCFDGIGHPIEQTGNLPSMGGCGKDGCNKSSLGGNMPFINDPTGTDYSKIVAKHSGKLVEVAGAQNGDSANVQQYDDVGGDHQRWLLESTGDGYFKIMTRHSGRCLDVQNSSNADAANVLQYGCGGSANQRFQLGLNPDGLSFSLQAKHSGKCLDVSGVSTANQANIYQWGCTGGDNQSFRFQ